MADKYPKSKGALFKNEDPQGNNAPQYRGHVEVTREQIDKLFEMGKAGLEPKLQLAVWVKTAQKTGQKYMFISAEAYMKPQANEWDEGHPQRGNRPAPQNSGWGAPSAPPVDNGPDDDVPF